MSMSPLYNALSFKSYFMTASILSKTDSNEYNPSALAFRPLSRIGNTMGGFSKSNMLMLRNCSVLW